MDVRDFELTSRDGTAGFGDSARISLLFHGVSVGGVALGGPRARRQLTLWRTLTSWARRPLLEELARRVIEHGVPPGEWQQALTSTDERPLPSVDVAICTRDRPEPLRLTLDALVPQVAPPCRVLVVDNAPSTSATRAIVESFRGRVHYTCEPTPGLDHARNHALASSVADVLAYVDDDVIADDVWLPRLRRAFTDPDVAMVTGLVEPFAQSTQAERMFEAFGGFGRGSLRRWLVAPRHRPIAFPWANTGRYGTGANLAFRRTLLRDVGGFDPALDAGTPSAGGGDLEAMFRIVKAGGLHHYAPQCRVRHMHRTTMAELEAQLRSWGTGMSAHVASIRAAFPDERWALHALDAWRFLRRLTSRVVMSAVLRPFPVSLAWAELLGSLEGGRLYRAGQRPGPARAWSPLPTGRPGVQAVNIDLATLQEPLPANGLSHLQVTATLRGVSLGSLRLPACDGWLGRERVRDAFIRRDPCRILGVPADVALAPILDVARRAL
ncbi:MAG: glycosyltransferase [Gemmatimonadetes bacterium]|nr:glycosyltransferase [Gemmatimonadota bacterium]